MLTKMMKFVKELIVPVTPMVQGAGGPVVSGVGRKLDRQASMGLRMAIDLKELLAMKLSLILQRLLLVAFIGQVTLSLEGAPSNRFRMRPYVAIQRTVPPSPEKITSITKKQPEPEDTS